MSLNERELGQLVGMVAAIVDDLQKPVAIADQTTFKPVLADFPKLSKVGFTRAQMAALCNRYFQEQSESSKRATSHRPALISET